MRLDNPITRNPIGVILGGGGGEGYKTGDANEMQMRCVDADYDTAIRSDVGRPIVPALLVKAIDADAGG